MHRSWQNTHTHKITMKILLTVIESTFFVVVLFLALKRGLCVYDFACIPVHHVGAIPAEARRGW
jgi:hypothetical protein